MEPPLPAHLVDASTTAGCLVAKAAPWRPPPVPQPSVPLPRRRPPAAAAPAPPSQPPQQDAPPAEAAAAAAAEAAPAAQEPLAGLPPVPPSPGPFPATPDRNNEATYSHTPPDDAPATGGSSKAGSVAAADDGERQAGATKTDAGQAAGSEITPAPEAGSEGNVEEVGA